MESMALKYLLHELCRIGYRLRSDTIKLFLYTRQD